MRAKRQQQTENVTKLETRTEKFKRLGQARVGRAIKHLQLIGNLAEYEHSDAQAERIMTALQDAVDGVRHRFERKEGLPPFTL